MAIRNIRILGDEILRKKSRNVEQIDEKIEILIDDMLETMYENNGVGLAAVQVGVLRKIIVFDVGEGPDVIINPEILEQDGKEIMLEGCLSIPGESGNVERPKKIKISYMDKYGEYKEMTAEDFKAQCLCHEIDHLNGILYIDRKVKNEE